MSNFMEIRPAGDELLHEDTHDEANSRFSQFFERACYGVSSYRAVNSLHLVYKKKIS